MFNVFVIGQNAFLVGCNDLSRCVLSCCNLISGAIRMEVKFILTSESDKIFMAFSKWKEKPRNGSG